GGSLSRGGSSAGSLGPRRDRSTTASRGPGPPRLGTSPGLRVWPPGRLRPPPRSRSPLPRGEPSVLLGRSNGHPRGEFESALVRAQELPSDIPPDQPSSRRPQGPDHLGARLKQIERRRERNSAYHRIERGKSPTLAKP